MCDKERGKEQKGDERRVVLLADPKRVLISLTKLSPQSCKNICNDVALSCLQAFVPQRDTHKNGSSQNTHKANKNNSDNNNNNKG